MDWFCDCYNNHRLSEIVGYWLSVTEIWRFIFDVIPLYVFGKIIYIMQKNKVSGMIVEYLIVGCVLFSMKPVIDYLKTNEIYELKCLDYHVVEAESMLLKSETIYYPADGDWMGYYHFSSTPYVARIPLIELRGTTLEGFKTKENYINSFVTTYGEAH